MKLYTSQFIVTAFKPDNSFIDNMKNHLELKQLFNLYGFKFKEIQVVQNNLLMLSLALEPRDYKKIVNEFYMNLHETRQIEDISNGLY